MRRASVVALLTLALLALAPMVPASAVSTAVTKLPVSASYKEMLRVNGDWLVWEDLRGATPSTSSMQVYGYNLATQQESALATGGSTGTMHRWPVVSGDNVVWWEQHYNTEDILGRNLSTGATFTVCAHSGLQRCPDISGDIVVWEDYRDAPATSNDPLSYGDIYGYNLATKTEFPICTAPGNQYQPAIWGDWVVWTDAGADWSACRIEGKNIRTGETFTVASTGGHRQDYPRVADGIVVFQVYSSSSDMDVYAYDLTSHRTYPVAATSAYESSGDVGGGVVAWLGDSGGRHTITGYDVYSGSPFTIVPPDHLSANYFAGLSGGNVAWLGTDAVYGSSGVYITHTTEVDGVIGSGRYETSVRASQAAFPSPGTFGGLSVATPASLVDTIVVATGENWPDGLGGGALAGVMHGPLLLTAKGALPPAVAAEVTRLNPKAAIILGGENAVSAAVASQLESLIGTGRVSRIAGANRYETASLVASEVIAAQGAGYDGTAFLATGGNFADALSASAVAAARGWPIYLCPSAGLTKADILSMKAHGVTKMVMLGSMNVVGYGTEARLDSALTTACVGRLKGANRYETCAAIANWAVNTKRIFAWSDFALTTGQSFPDGLSASVLQGKLRSPVLLTPTWTLAPETSRLLKTNSPSIRKFRYVGGALLRPVRVSVRSIVH